MGNKLPRIKKTTLVLGAATMTVFCLPCLAQTQTGASQTTTVQDRTQDRPAAQSDDITRRDLARFDQFLDSHRDIAGELRRTPSLIDDPQYLQRHPELNSYLQEHPSVKQEISQQPNTFMRLEDQYGRDQAQRDRDANWQDRDANNNRDAGQDRDRRDVASFDRFLDDHREIGEQVRKDPSLVDNQRFVHDHPALQTYLQDNPGVRDQLRQDPGAFMRQVDAYNHDQNAGDRNAVGQDRDAYNNRDANNNRDAGQDRDRRDVASLNRFLDDHREIGEQIRKNPSLADDRQFVDSHPALQAYLQDNPGVRDQLRQDPNAFMHQADVDNRDMGGQGHDAMHDHMAEFGGWLGNHPDIQKDVSRDPSCVKDHQYVQQHAELDAYLNAHPDVRSELMADPQNFVHGAQQFGSTSPSGSGVSGHVTGTTGTTGSGASMTGSATGTSTTPATTTHESTKPNQ